MNSASRALLVLLLVVVALVDACPGLFGGGGCCAPPPPPCACGRKKRDTEQTALLIPSIQTEQKDPCPQTDWLSTLQQNMGADPTSNAYAVQGALFRRYGAKFNVICMPTDMGHAFVANGDAYCSHKTVDNWCQATALLG